MFLAIFQGFTGVKRDGGTFNPRYIGEFIVQSMPIILSGLSVGFAFRVGLFNIGAEGQFMAGSMAAIAVALWVHGAAGNPRRPRRSSPRWRPGASGAPSPAGSRPATTSTRSS